MPILNDEQFAKSVVEQVKAMQVLADGMAADGFLEASGVVLAGVQTIKVLNGRLQAALAPPIPAEGMVPAAAAPPPTPPTVPPLAPAQGD